MLKKTLLIMIVLLSLSLMWSQSNPTPQTLPYAQDFANLTHTSTTYPAGWQGWSISGNPGTAFKTTAPLADRTLTASSAANTTSGNVHNYNGKIGMLTSSSLDLSLALALNTTGKQNVTVVYDIMTIRNPYDGGSNTRINEATLQYRIGDSGTFTAIDNNDILYQNNTTTQTTAVTDPQNAAQIIISLPADCNDQAIVQIRWVSRQVSGAGSRPSFAIDDVAVTAESISSDPAIVITQSLTQFTTFVNVVSEVQTYHLAGINLNLPIEIATNLPFQIRTPEGVWDTTLEVAADYNGLIEVRFNPTTEGASTIPITHIGYYGTFQQIVQSFNVSGTATAATPVISVTQALSDFSAIVGSPSAAQSYTLTGLNLSANIAISVPAGFELSTDGGTNYSSTGSVAANYNGLIYVRLTGQSTGDYSGQVLHTSTGATNVNFVVTGSVVDPAVPSILFEENFDYVANSTLVLNGWTAHSGANSNSPTVASPGLTYPNYPLFSGLAAQTYNTGEDVHRTFAPISVGSTYCSFLINLDSATTTGDYIFHLGPDPISTFFRGRVFAQKDASNNVRFGLSKAGNLATAIFTDYVYSLGTTYLILIKYDIIPEDSNDMVYMWVNPNFSGTEPAPQITATDLNTDIAVGSVAIRQGGATSSPIGKIDGIRVSNNWNIHWQGNAIDGEILVNGEFEPFIAIAGAPSERQTYNLQGVDLVSNITISASAGFQVSLDNINWASVATAPPDYNGEVHARMYVQGLGLYSGTISHTSGGADQVNFGVTGEAIAPEGEIIVVQNISPFFGATGIPTVAQTYSVSGTDLSGDITVTATAPFEIKLSSSSTWSSTLLLDDTFNGNLDVRMNAVTPGTFNGRITHESNNVSNVVINLSGTATMAVANIAALRASATGTTVYTLVGEAVLTYQKATRNQKYIQDATAAIVIDDMNGTITSTYNVGDGITGITGTLNVYAQLLQFVPTRDPGTATSTGNVIVPEVRTLSSLTNNDQAKLIKVMDVSFTGASGNFAVSANLPITDPSGAAIFRTAFNADPDGCDYIGTPIPTTPKNIVCLVGQYNADMQITARYLSDFSEPSVAVATKLVITGIDPISPYANTAFSVSIQTQDNDNVPRAVDQDTQISITLASGTGALSGTVTGTILSGTNSVTISGILYNTVEGITLIASATTGMTLLPATSSAIVIQSIPTTPTASVLLRPSQIDIANTASQSAVLMQLQAYPTDDVRYRLYNGGNQYNCWNGTTYVASTSYGSGPLPIGTPTTSATWWIVFERGNNATTDGYYRDRQGPGYTANYKTVALPAATEITDPFAISLTLPLNPVRYDFNNKYVVLAYDQEVGGTLVSATSSDLTTGSFNLSIQNGTVIRRLEVRALNNTLMESLTGEWDGEGGGGYYEAVTGLTGNTLRQGLQTITSTGHINNSWDNSRYYIYSTLDNVNNTVSCVYTDQSYAHPAGENSTPTGLSAEHSYPQEWFDGHAETAWAETDLHALFPANSAANSARSNYPYDYVSSITSSWGSTAYMSFGGTNAATNNAFDVADQFKGDAARAILYFGMRYYDDDANFVRGSVNLLPIMLQWNEQDPVDAYEISRNNGVYAFQGNRNPFVDYPEWISSIWGDIAIATPVATAPTGIGEHSFTANWNAVTGATTYRLDVATNNTFTSFVTGYKNKIVNSNSQLISALDPATTYYYRVRALNADGALSLNSNTYTAVTTTGGSVSYYWNFNTNVPASGVNWVAPIVSTIGSGSISYNLTKAVSFAGTLINGESGEVTGGSFVPQGGATEVENNGNYMEIAMPTTGLQNIIFSYATQRTTSGFNSQEFQYSSDGTNFNTFTSITDIPTSWGIRSVDFSSLTAANNNPNFKIRIVFSGATTPTGNNRIDNIKVFATASGTGIDAPVNMLISNDGTNVNLSWDAVTGASSYQVYSSSNPDSGFTLDNSGSFTGTTWTATVTNQIRFYRVTAVQ